MFRRQTDIEGGRMIYGREYISALQNRNKTNLVELLGSAPPIVEEIIPEDANSRYMKDQIIKSIKGGVGLLGRMSGLSRIPGGLQQIAQQSQDRFQSRIEFELQSLFLPLQGFTRDVLFEYESHLNEYQTGAGIGGMVGGFTGAVVGFYYLGPAGAQLLGWLGQTMGAYIGAQFEAGITAGGDPRNPLESFTGFDPFGWAGVPEDELDPSGGLPDLTFTGGTYWAPATPGSILGSVHRMDERLSGRVIY